ncbi:MAG: AMP-binding protein [Pyrinomonadaceae bacterium]|nr:AMP-binding protein [Pyrinomonadaceae bacterium]
MSGNFNDLVSLLERRQQQQPDQLAFEFVVKDQLNGELLTYGELADNAKRVGAILQSYLKEGDAVMLLLRPGLPLISALFGAFYAKAVAALIPPPVDNQSRNFFKSVTQNLLPRVIITTEAVKKNLDEQIKEIPVLQKSTILTVEEAMQATPLDWKPDGQNSEKSPCLIQYTSGSTNSPKGVVLSQENLMQNSMVIKQSFFHTSKSYGVIWLPPYHDMGLIGGIIQPVYSGFPTTLLSPKTFLQKPLRWLKLVTEKKATTSGGPNFAYDLCVKKISESEKEELDLSSWEVAFNGSERVNPKTIDEFSNFFKSTGFRKGSFLSCYGLAESTLYVTGGLKREKPLVVKAERTALTENKFDQSAENDADHIELVSCGFPAYGQAVKIVSPEGKVCRQHEIGEIWVSSPSNALGYWMDESSSEKFSAELNPSDGKKYFQTGDLGFFYKNELFITGRIKDLLIVRGKNHYHNDIEYTVKNSHRSLKEGKVITVGIENNGGRDEKLVVIHEIKNGGLEQPESNEIIAAIRERIAEKHQIAASEIILVRSGEITTTRNGKQARFAAKQKYLNGDYKVIASWSNGESSEKHLINHIETAPQTDSLRRAKLPELTIQPDNLMKTREAIKDWLARAVASEAKIDPSEIDQNLHFGLYGLDSLSAASIVAELEDRLGSEYELNETLLWDYPNLNSASDYLAREVVRHHSQKQCSETELQV